MRREMSDLLIQTSYRINLIRSNHKLFKKLFILKEIHDLKKSLKKKLLNKKSYTAVDIVSFSVLVDTAKTLGLSGTITNEEYLSIGVSCIKGVGRTRWPVFGIIDIVIHTKDGDQRTTCKANMDSEVDMTGSIVLSWNSPKVDNTGSIVPLTNDRNYMISELESIPPKDYNKDIQGLSKQIIETTYELLPNVFTIYIEKICMGLKEKYLNESSKTK